MSGTIVVLGATGTQGSSMVTSLLASRIEWTVRAVTCNPDSAAAKSLASRGVEVLKETQVTYNPFGKHSSELQRSSPSLVVATFSCHHW